MSEHYEVTGTGAVKVDAQRLIRTSEARRHIDALKALVKQAAEAESHEKLIEALYGTIEELASRIEDLSAGLRYESDIAEQALQDLKKVRDAGQLVLDWNDGKLEVCPITELNLALEETK